MQQLLLTTLTFLAVGALALGVSQVVAGVAGPERRKLRRRLEGVGDRGDGKRADRNRRAEQVKVTVDLEDEFPGWTRPLMGFGPAQKLTGLLAQGTPDLKLDRFLMIAGGCFGALFLVVLLFTFSVVVAAIAGLCAASVPLLWVTKRRNGRQRQMEDQLPQALDFLSRALRAGHSMSTALALMGEELPRPLGEEFQRAYDQHALGVDMDTVLRQSTRRVESVDYAFFITAILIQRQTGGDLASVLDNIGDMIRGRIKLQKQVKAKTAEGRFTGYVLAVFPMVMFVICYLMNPETWRVMLETTPGVVAMGLTLCMQGMGLYMIRKLTTLKV